MLGKLIKHDMRSLLRLILPLTLAIIASALLCTLALRLVVSTASTGDGSGYEIMIISSLGAYIFLNAAAVLIYPTVVTILIMYNFYKNLYTDEGYLTFTLPVKRSSILLSKFLTAEFWTFISFVVTSGCVAFAIFFGTATDTLYNTDIMPFIEFILQFVDVTFTAPLIFYIISMVAGSLFQTVIIFLAITIGSIVAKKLKLLAAIGIYYAMDLVTSIVISVIGFIMMIPSFMSDSSALLSSITLQPLVNGIIYVGFAVASYILTNSLMKNKLNLP